MSESMGEVDGKADVGKRIVAVIIDAISVGLLSMVLGAALGWVLAFALSSAAALYLFGWRMGETGTTPGKKIMGLKIVDASTGELLGNQRGLQRAGLIWVLGLAGSFPFIGLLFSLLALGDIIVALIDDRGQRYTDKIVGSIVANA
jgi:uncharacterized RDD family membrane protein YckC